MNSSNCKYKTRINVCIHKNNFQNSYLYYQERLFSSLRIMHVLKYCYIKNVTVCVNYTDFYTRVYTTVYFSVTKPTLSISSKIIIDTKL